MMDDTPTDFDPAAIDFVLSTTRSVRRRIDFARPLDPDVVEDCIALALQAPAGGVEERRRFLVVTEPETKGALAQVYRRSFEELREARAVAGNPGPRAAQAELAANLERMPAIIICCIAGEPEPGDTAQQVALYGSILPAAWSLMLALRARGIGATWTTLHLRNAAEAAELLGIPPGVTQTVLLPAGYMEGARLRPAERTPAREVTFWERWGQSRP